MRGMEPADVGALVDVSDPRVSPDGSTIAFVVATTDAEENTYPSRIWLAAADASVPPYPFTSGEHRECRPRWSPDGRFLAFVSRRRDKGDKGTELCVVPVAAGGERRQVAAWAEEIEEVAWSPDATRIAFTAREREEDRYGKEKAKDQPPRRITRLHYRLDSVGWTADRPRHVFVVPADGSAKPQALTSGEFQDSGLAWSPDGTRLAFASGRHPTWDLDMTTDIYVIEALGGGEPVRLTETSRANGSPSWSPDGSSIAFVINDRKSPPRNGQVAVLDLETDEERLLTASLDRHCCPYLAAAREPVWEASDLLFQVEDHGNTALYRVPADGSGKPEPLLEGDRQITGFDTAGGTTAFVATMPTQLTELYAVRDGEEQRLTSVGTPFARSRMLVAPERFTATSPDGTEVEAWMMRPAGFVDGATYPALLNIHGGPFSQYGNKFLDEFQVQAGSGYVVLYCNPRGSSGYGEAWARAVRGTKAGDDPGTGWAGQAYDDVMAVVDEAVRRFPVIDSDRLGVLGGSYGGFMTSWIVGHTDRFRAAVSERAVNNMLTMVHTSDIGFYFNRGYVGPTHLEDPEEYVRQSPVTYVADITTPVLILHSEDDLRCPVEQAEDLFVAMRLLGKEVEFVRFPGESHELSRSGSPKHRIQRLEIVLEFLDRHLRAAA